MYFRTPAGRLVAPLAPKAKPDLPSPPACSSREYKHVHPPPQGPSSLISLTMNLDLLLLFAYRALTVVHPCEDGPHNTACLTDTDNKPKLNPGPLGKGGPTLQFKLNPVGKGKPILHETSDDGALPPPVHHGQLYLGGGAQRSYFPPALIDGQVPQLLTASEAEAWCPGEWWDGVYAWKVVMYEGDERVCLCQAAALCGCGSTAWKRGIGKHVFSEYHGNFDAGHCKLEGAKGWGVNGTMDWLEKAVERRYWNTAEWEKGPESGVCKAPGGFWGWWVDWWWPRPWWCYEDEIPDTI